MHYQRLILTCCFNILTLCTYALEPSKQVLELKQYIDRCDATMFKDKLAAFTAQLQNPQEKIDALHFFEAYTQEQKAEKGALLEQISSKRIQHRISAYKAAGYLCGTVFFGLASVIAIGKGLLDPAFARQNEQETMAARCAMLVVIPITVWLAVLMKHTFHTTLHYSAIIRKNIQELDEIITVINQARVRCHIAIKIH